MNVKKDCILRAWNYTTVSSLLVTDALLSFYDYGLMENSSNKNNKNCLPLNHFITLKSSLATYKFRSTNTVPGQELLIDVV